MNNDDFKLLRGFGDRLTNGRTFVNVNVESLSRAVEKFVRFRG